MPAIKAKDTHAGVPPQDQIAPMSQAIAVTPHDTNELARVTRALYVGGAGTISVLMFADTVPVTMTVPSGTTLNIRVRQVRATGTTATNIVAFN